jgi:hypothetical protein
VKGCVSGQGRFAFHGSSVVDAIGLAKRPAECTEVYDGVASVLCGQLKWNRQRGEQCHRCNAYQCSGFHLLPPDGRGLGSREVQRQEPERKRTKNFAASPAVLYLLHGVEERENGISIPSDKHHLLRADEQD